MKLTLKIGRRETFEAVLVGQLVERYEEVRDESGEGASTFPNGKITGHPKGPLTISYNGRVWIGDPAARNEFEIED